MSYMSFCLELNNLNLAELISRWNNEVLKEYECVHTYYSELACLILDKGKSGREYLTSAISHESNPARLGAILWLLPSPENPLPQDVLLQYLHENEPYVMSCAIRGLINQGEKDAIDDVLALKLHSSPYVRARVLEFLSKLHPESATSLLIEALQDSDYIVRESAIDELDDLGIVESIADIKPLLSDPHPHVRQAAKTAIKNLEYYSS